MVLLNAVYFKGLWKQQFYPASTRKETFYVSPHRRSIVDMMSQTGDFRYGDIPFPRDITDTTAINDSNIIGDDLSQTIFFFLFSALELVNKANLNYIVVFHVIIITNLPAFRQSS